eukprot:gene22193-13712_t
MTASATKPKWLSMDRSWDAPAWYSFNLSNTTFQQPARFSGCTDYGLVGYYILQSGGWTFSDWKAVEMKRYKHMHETLCYVWFDGAWNQGTWAGLGNALISRVWPDTSNKTTPWAYPFLTRRQHALKVYNDWHS